MFAKVLHAVTLQGKTITVTGDRLWRFTNMATMLGYITTDASIDHTFKQRS
jgi:hypothetical protein